MMRFRVDITTTALLQTHDDDAQIGSMVGLWFGDAKACVDFYRLGSEVQLENVLRVGRRDSGSVVGKLR